MSFGGSGGGGSRPIPPPYTPTSANPTVITAGLSALRPQSSPGLSDTFTSLINTSGGLGRKPDISGRSLMGGA